MKNRWKADPEGMAESIRYKDGNYRSKLEEAFAQILDDVGLEFVYEGRSFPYTLNGKSRRYTPDFFVPYLNKYFEVKPKRLCNNLDVKVKLLAVESAGFSIELVTEDLLGDIAYG